MDFVVELLFEVVGDVIGAIVENSLEFKPRLRKILRFVMLTALLICSVAAIILGAAENCTAIVIIGVISTAIFAIAWIVNLTRSFVK